jgi:hypothetical protein
VIPFAGVRALGPVIAALGPGLVRRRCRADSASLHAQAKVADPARYAWQPAGNKPPAGGIVPLGGHEGWAHDAILSLQWWFGKGEGIDDYYRPEHMCQLIAALVAEKRVAPGKVFFKGFSRSSANSYAMVALDNAATGKHYFGLVLSNAGGVFTDYPPNQQIVAGAYGTRPFRGVRLAMYCGGKDPAPPSAAARP